MLSSRFFLFFLISWHAGLLWAQPPAEGLVVLDYPGQVVKSCTLPGLIKETSGLIYFDDAAWSFNDSGGKPELYKINPETGALLQTVVIRGANNRDWEDICQDEDHIFIGDFGNNRGTRRDLCIYKVAKKDITEGTKVVVPEQTIFFSYGDQDSYALKDRSNNFDCESMVSYGDDLLIFSKNWINGRTRMYRLPKDPGIYSVKPLDEFDAAGLVTGADFCSKNNRLILVGYTLNIPFLIVFEDFNGKKMDPSGGMRINLPTMARQQTEGICFVDESRLLMSAEQTRQGDQALYSIDLGKLSKPENLKK